MIESGIHQPGECLDKALAAGMTPAAIIGVLDHFQQYPGRWPVGVLFARLTKPGMQYLAADAGWFGETAQWTARELQRQERMRSTTRQPDAAHKAREQADRHRRLARLEERHGARLDALNRVELLELAERAEPSRADDLRQAIRINRTGGHRWQFLELLDAEPVHSPVMPKGP